MAIVFAAVGGGLIVAAAETYDNHSEYSDYSNYSDYSEYDDADERRWRRIERLEEDLRVEISDLESYKKKTVNRELTSQRLKRESALTVSKKEMDQDVTSKLDAKKDGEIKTETEQLEVDLAQIDKLLRKIDEIQGEE